MSKDFFTNAFRFVILCLFQILVLQEISLSFPGIPYINIIVYPLFILLLPFTITPIVLTILGFVTGITIDIFYDSMGIHASICLVIAYFRPSLIRRLEPKGGYVANSTPTPNKMGWPWFLQYSGILMTIHLFLYFSVKAFTFVFIVSILLKTITALVLSMIFIILLVAIFNPSS